MENKINSFVYRFLNRFSHLCSIYFMIRRIPGNTICTRFKLVRFKMSQKYNLDKHKSHLNIIEQQRRIHTLKYEIEICQCCRSGTMVWTEVKEHYEKFCCNDCMHMNSFDMNHFFMWNKILVKYVKLMLHLQI